MELNPNCTIPMLTHGSTKVIGEGEAIFNYVVNANERVSAHFNAEDQKAQIKNLMQYFLRTVRRASAKLIQAITNVKVLNQKKSVNEARINDQIKEFFEIIMNKIDD